MAYWKFGGGVYEVVSFYSVAGDAWMYELTGPAGKSASAPGLTVATPDDGPFTAAPAAAVLVTMTEGVLPWPMLIRFMDLVGWSGDIAEAAGDPVVSGTVRWSLNKWVFADRRYEVNSYSLSEQDCWCYELCQTLAVLPRNDFIEVRVPDHAPDREPLPASWAEGAVVQSHGECDVPWLVLRHFLDLVGANEDLSAMPPSVLRDSAPEHDSARPTSLVTSGRDHGGSTGDEPATA